MRHAESKYPPDARADAVGFALVIVAAISAVTTALWGLSFMAQTASQLMP